MHRPGFTPAQWRRVADDYTAWWKGDLNRALVRLVLGEPDEPDGLSGFVTNWPADMTDDAIVDAVVRRMSSRRLYGDAIPFFFVNYGPGIGAVFAGGGLRTAPDTTWFEPVPHRDLSDIRITLNTDNEWWQRILHVTQILADRLGDRVQISFTDIGGNLDILASLRGTNELLVDLVAHPEDVDRCAQDVTALWLEVYDRLCEVILSSDCPGTIAWAPTWAPGPTYMLQSDFSYMISPNMFERFVLPDIKACSDHLEYAFYHMDGVGQIPHLDHLLAVESLRGIQWIPGTGKPMADGWPDLLARIREAGKLVQVYVTPEGAMEIVRRHGGKGFLLAVHEAGMTDAEAERFVTDIRGR